LAKATASEQTLTEQNNKLLLENNTHIKSLSDADAKYQQLEAKYRAEKDQLNLQIRALTAKVSAPVSNDDWLSKMIQIGVVNNSQKEMTIINDAIDMLKQKHDISVREHLGFDSAATQQLKFHTYKNGAKSIGELNFDNNLHGKGICIWSNGNIRIGCYNNGFVVPGNYLAINSNGEGNLIVGEVYIKGGKRWIKGTQYHTDGK